MRLAWCAIVAVLVSTPAAAQQASASGTFVVTRNGAEVGRERFTIEPMRATDRSGTTLVVSSRYPGAAQAASVDVRLERGADGELALLQMDMPGNTGATRILAAGAGARVILRTISEGAEAGRELPGGGDVVLLDEHAVTLFQAVADLATPEGRRLTAVYPRTGRRAQFLARASAADGARRVTLTGEITGTLTVGDDGHLQRVELPGAGVVATLE